MDNSDLKCCICNQNFNLTSQPRMMPYCQHSACTVCIKKIINHKTNDFLKCQHCGHEENLHQVDLEYFPKNIALTKLIKQMSQSNESKLQSKNSKDSENSVTEEPKIEVCKIHNKELEIICITDKEKLCPHCALFGTHKDHIFKTLNEAGLQMQEMKRYFQGCRKRKQAIDQKMNSKDFKQNLISKIGKEKDRLVSEIKLKFSSLYDNIRLAEKQAFQDVVKHFKTIYNKIVALMKQQNDSQLKYKQWEQRCAQLFVQANKLKTIQEKSFIYFGGPMDICKEGEIHLKKIQNKLDSNMSTIEKLITSIKVIDNVSAANSLFNYVNIVVDSQDIQMITQVSHEVIELKQKEDTYKPKMIQITIPQQYSSPSKISTLRQVTPKKRSSSKDKNLNRTSQRRNQAKSASSQAEKLTIQKMVQEFCERQNLDTLDLTGYNLLDSQILDVLKYLKQIKKIKGLKLVKNRLTNQGLAKLIEMIPTVTNLNLSFNQLEDEALSFILSAKQRIPMLRIINISNNKINERKVKTTLEQLKRQGIIVTI